jgi:hypothetical protein
MTAGLRSAHGMARSRSPASASSVDSSAFRAASWTPIGQPSVDSASGRLIAGIPVAL